MKPIVLKPWDQLSREEQDLYLSILWNDDYSEHAIADFLKATKGKIVRRRQTGLRLPTGTRDKVKSFVEPGRFFDLLDIHEMDKMQENGVTPMYPVEEQKTCVWPIGTGRSLKATELCGKSVVQGGNLCEEHLRRARHPGAKS